MRTLAFVLFFFCGIWGDDAFSKARWESEAVWLQAHGDLTAVIPPTVSGGVGVLFSYWGDSWWSSASLRYAHLPASGKSIPLHFVLGRAGILWSNPSWQGAGLEGGVALFFARSSLEEESDNYLDDNESEYGFYSRLRSPMWSISNYSIQVMASWESAFTSPQASSFVSIALSFGGVLWE